MTDTVNHPVTPPAAGFGADPRPGFSKALALAGQTLAAVRADQFDDATPCTEYNVRDLSNHLVSILRRVAAIGRGEAFFTVPNLAEDIADGAWAEAWDAAVREVEAVWSDPSMLGRPHQLPMGMMPGAIALVIYTTEFTLHTWDLATATGQTPAWDPSVLAPSLASMKRAVPADARTTAPFGAVVDVPADAPAIDQLVAWYGRRP
ncbi:uncharacterized protein (TIGR03086 family) [Kitasatospora sp. MAA4]|uniref:TIGR03086 family metal-binding protein n=1 Tax=Kitasatospora sp. MAA4 TaxID=3035093 RepID=UPI0024771D8A|nr:TIGR03086 family metal-binding protein [Kitasatospora sp. MAA4]MDH6132647.1 uncharacterized protein (TIGR03086 family) [Kitasatospora sp. MAA4]